ncbi:chromate efflux transporter [Sinomicrobium weinanense]|uniref:Chromate efflux transporter n=1 Tax=Sinomicrobium weinanense TaxID=2842200 RepID=A0A926JUV1_9FLAO|nr:chromate efflux transporter [Sinomicrobium weinanense]MBC9797794.1 chromate efflux transporter [Sinomicrobium weinanense]MBU3124878.1 chromate efflux transporter [Sinomicrobium weinanense]
MNKNGNLREVAKVFFKLGLIAFGGPAAHIAMMENEVVTKRKWMSRQHFLDLVGATNLIPGPNSTEMTMHCGYERAGWKGLFVAGSCFIFPAVVFTGILAWFYVEYGKVPTVEPFLYGIKPAVIAIILGAVYKLGKKALKNRQLGVIGMLVIILSFLGVNEITAILGAGLAGLLWFGLLQREKGNRLFSFLPALLINAGMITAKTISNTKLFFVFLKIGAVLFGSGYVLVAYLDGELVEKLEWLTKQELLDAIAIGQFTPGPVLSTATFIGYQVNGLRGALAATAGIFLPSFFFVLLLNPIIPKLRQSRLARGFLDAVNIGAVGIMIAVTVRLGQEILMDWKSWMIAILSIVITFKLKKVSAVWIVIGGAVLGYILHFV